MSILMPRPQGRNFVVLRGSMQESQRHADLQMCSAPKIELRNGQIYAYDPARGYMWLIDRPTDLLHRQRRASLVGVSAGWSAFIWQAKRVLIGREWCRAVLIVDFVGGRDDSFFSRMGGPWSPKFPVLLLNSKLRRGQSIDGYGFALPLQALALMGWK